MSRPTIELDDSGRYAFFRCPGCGQEHNIGVGPGVSGPQWQWNGDKVRPTFAPSILARGNRLVYDAHGEWTGTWERDERGQVVPYVCHSFVVDGSIQFLADCTHPAAGTTLRLPPRLAS